MLTTIAVIVTMCVLTPIIVISSIYHLYLDHKLLMYYNELQNFDKYPKSYRAIRYNTKQDRYCLEQYQIHISWNGVGSLRVKSHRLEHVFDRDNFMVRKGSQDFTLELSNVGTVYVGSDEQDCEVRMNEFLNEWIF